MGILDGKRILLCVTGGIAAFKSAELVRMMTKQGAEVRVAMTAAATRFVGPLTFQALSTRSVLLDLFDPQRESQISHIEAARWPDCIVIVPATANIIGKLANGLADDLVSTLLLAARKTIVIAPAMNWAMWQNEIVQANLKRLSEHSRFVIVPPDSGELACGEEGKGRLAALDEILDAAVYAARTEQDLEGETVLVTAGPTYEDIDPVRYVANRSSGKMGFAIAREARARGAKVILISGPNDLIPPSDVEVVSIRSADQMLEATLKHAKDAQIIIKAAAVADYRPARRSDQKIHKEQSEFSLPLTRTADILKELGNKKRAKQFLVGFAAETHQVMQNGRNKLNEKKLDMIVVNDISLEGAGFEVDTNVVKIIDRKGHIESLPMLAKSEVARILFDLIQKERASQSNGRTSRSSRGGRSNQRPSRSRSRSRSPRKPVAKNAEPAPAQAAPKAETDKTISSPPPAASKPATPKPAAPKPAKTEPSET